MKYLNRNENEFLKEIKEKTSLSLYLNDVYNLVDTRQKLTNENMLRSSLTCILVRQ